MKHLIKGTTQLSISNLVAQLISLILMVVVCKNYYTPSELSTFTIFQSIISFYSGVFIFRIDTLFYIEKENNNRYTLFSTSKLLLAISALVFAFISYLLNFYSFTILIISIMGLSIYLLGSYNLGQSYLINENKYLSASISRIIFPIINLILSIILINIGFKDYALIFGLFFGISCSVIFQFIKIENKNKQLNKVKKLFSIYKKDLIYTNLLFIVNSFRDSLFITFISLFYSSKEIVASYSQGLRIVSLPSLVLSGAIGNVVASYLKIEIDNIKKFRQQYFKLLIIISICSIFIYLVSYFIMDYLVIILFSKKWIYTASCAKSLIPLLFMNFILNSLNGYFLILRLQLYNLIINILDISIFIFSFVIFNKHFKFEETLFYSSIWSLFFGIILITILTYKINKTYRIEKI